MSVIDDLTSEFARLPGIGRKSALRLTYHLLKQPIEQCNRLAHALTELKLRIKPCEQCGNLSDSALCVFCADPRRDAALICVVEDASDIGSIERSGEFRGVYHVLGGRLSPLDGIGPDDLTVSSLVRRVVDNGVREVIVATNPSLEGEATALYVQRQLASSGARVTRIARGLPVGGDLEYADGVTIAQALSARRDMK
ncbi:MAG: recombination mediator RecR [Gemmatimonadaceae bacterium]